MIVVELIAATDAGGTLQTLLVSDVGFSTTATDTPASTYSEGRLIDPGSLGLNLFGDGRTSGTTQLQLGEIVIGNVDGGLDAWRTYGFDGRAVIIRRGDEGAAYPAGFTTVLTATVDGAIEATFDTLTLRLRDRSFVFDQPLLTTRYLGTNSGATGVEGTASDIKGKVKPRVYGKVLNIEPVQVNSSKLTYQVSDRAVASFQAVYDNGAAITAGANYATEALLTAAVVGAGTYATSVATGLFRLGSSPTGQITCDVTQGTAAANRTAAQIIQAIAGALIIPGLLISSADVTALDTANSSVVGIYINDEMTALEAIDRVAASVGAYAAIDRTGTLRMGRLTAPSGTSVASLEDWNIQNIELVALRDLAVPVWSVKVNHTKLGVVQSAGLAGSVTAATRVYLGQEYRSISSTDATIRGQYQQAGTLEINTLLTSDTNAQTEADRLLALYKVRREQFRATISLSFMLSSGIDFMSPVTLTLDRFGLNAGKLFFVTGYELNLATETATLTLWG